MKGSLQIKNGKYYAVISTKDEYGKYKKIWINTGFEIKGNKKKAEQKLNELLIEYDNGEILQNKRNDHSNDILFGDYLQKWLLSIKNKVEEITYESYTHNVNILANYFNDKKIYLKELKPYHIQDYYNHLHKLGRSGNTAIHYHVLIREALQSAVKQELIEKNVADFVDRPRKEKYQAKFYNKQELKKLFDCIKDDPLELVIHITAFYGLRRSEVLGLKWSAIDFENKMININHKVVRAGKIILGKNKMKNKTSNRTLPLIPHIEEILIKAKEQQEQNKKLFGNTYNKKYLDYVCVDPMGKLLRPDYITQHFRRIQNNHNLKQIRFHDLRHSCASLMLANNVPMKQIQEWLGHSTFQTTADIYAHLDYSSKLSSANAISNALTFENEEPKQEPVLDLSSYEQEQQNYDEQKLDYEIEELERQLAEKKRQRQKDDEMEM